MEKTFENGVYYTPGKKVLYYFSVNRVLPVVFVFIFLQICFYFLHGFAGLKETLSIISVFLIIVGIIFCIIALVAAYIKYNSVQFMFDEFAFHIKKGFLSKSEIAIPYRQIQSINHSQGLNQKMLGIMSIVIETAGEDESKEQTNDIGLLPTLDANIALSVEKELLNRSNTNSINK